MDVASLGLSVQAVEVERATQALDKFATSAGPAESGARKVSMATDRINGSMGGATSAVREMAAAIAMEEAALNGAARASGTFAGQAAKAEVATDKAGASARQAALSYDAFYDAANRDFATQYVRQMNSTAVATGRAGRGAKLASHEMLNLSRQFADIGVTAAMGMNPLMILIQQGPQIADTFAVAGARGVGFKAALGQIAAAAAPFAVVLGAIAAVVGVVAGGFAVLTQQINKGGESAKEIQKRLHLTDEQMKKVKNTSVTMGDTIAATFSVIGDRIWDAIGPTMKSVGKVIADVYQDVVDWTGNAVKAVVMSWGGAIGAIGAAWKLLPGAVGDAVVSTVNFVLSSVEKMVNWIIDKINVLIAGINLLSAPLASVLGFDLTLPALNHVEVTRIANQFEGAGKSFAVAMTEGWADGAKGAGKAFDQFFADIEAKAKANRDKRVREEAGKGPKGSRGGATDFDRALASAQEAVLLTNMQAAATERLNDQIAAGVLTVAQAQRQQEIDDRLAPYRIEADKAKGIQKTMLLSVVKLLEQAYHRLNAAEDKAADLRVIEDQNRTLEALKLENSLIGEGNTARAVQLAQLRERQEIMARGGPGHVMTSEEEQRVANAGAIARSQASLATAQALYNRQLDRTLDRLTQIDDLVQSSADGLASAFDGMSDSASQFTRALGGVLGAMTKLSVTEERLNRERQDSWKAVADAMKGGDIANLKGLLEEYGEVSKRTALEMQHAQVGAYAEMAGAAKTFFKEGTEGYELLKSAEVAFRTVQFAMAVQAMALQAQESQNAIVASMGKAVASTIAGVAKAFEQMGIWGFAGAGAIIAFMAAVGVNSGFSAPKYDLEGVQSRQGTGTVLGEADRKSDSIARSLELVADHTNDMLEYNNAMLRSLRSIDSNIENLAAAVARSLGLSGVGAYEDQSYNPIKQRQYQNDVLMGLFAPGGADWGRVLKGVAPGFGSGNILKDIFAPGALDPLGLFDSKVSKKLVDAGITFTAQSLGQILTEGLKASYFQVIRTVREDKAFGFTYSTSVKDKTTMTGVEADLQRQFSLVIGSLRDGVVSAASVLGVEGAQAVLDAFQVNIGKVSFKDMDSAEITATLEAIFSKLGDEMAASVIPGLTEFQRAGEGLFETLMRVARQYQVIDVTLASVGMTFGAVGLSSLAARERLIDLFGSLDDFTDRVSFYSENFLTEAERLAPIQAALNAEMARLGITGLDTRDEFKALVQSLDLTTASGAEMFAALMAIAPAFAAVTEESKAVADARDRLSSAYERESSALENTKAQFEDLAKSLGSFSASLYSGPAAALSPEAAYMAAKAEFDRVQALIAAGDTTALDGAQDAFQALLDASRAYNASGQGYFSDLASVRAATDAAQALAQGQVDVATQQLETMRSLVDPILNIDQNIGTVAEELAAYLALTGAGNPNTPVVIAPQTTMANDNSDVVAELQGQNQQLQQVVESQAAAMKQQAAMHSEQQAELSEIRAELIRIRQQGQEAA